MKILQKVQKDLALVGFHPNQQQNSKKTFGKLQTIEIFLATLCTIQIGVYFLYVANSTEEYMYSFFALIAGVSLTLTFICLAVKNDKIFNTTDMFEQIINESELQFCFILLYQLKI